MSINNKALETVEIDDGNGSYIVINRREFNPEIHAVYGEKQPVTTRKAKAAKVPAGESGSTDSEGFEDGND